MSGLPALPGGAGAATGALVLSGLAALLPSRARSEALFRALVTLGCGLLLWSAVRVLAGAAPTLVSFRPALPGGPWRFGVDGLSAWFLLIVGAIGVVAAWYGVPYLAPEREHRPVRQAHAGVALLLAAMVGVLTAQAILPFLLAWETMAVTAYFLIVFESERPDVRRAGLIYLVLTHAGTLALVAMFLSWSAQQGDLTFASLSRAAPALRMGGAGVLLLALLGFGVKAGVVPLHFWLPGAHAAAPSHISALLSAVMLKTGIYGLFRVLSLLGAPPAWFGWVLLGLGALSGLLGILWALGQGDLKRALAYSSVENVGIILLGLGLGVIGLAYRQPAVAALGFGAALLHAVNHALIKALLFLGAGSLVQATGTRTLDRLSGLGRALPRTALLFGLGAVAISGLPPLNGFLGEWVGMQGLLRAGSAGGPLAAAVLGAIGLALVAGLALACFARIAGILWLGEPRAPAGEPVAVAASGDRPGLVAPMVLLAAGCLLIGVLPALVVRPALALAGALSAPAGSAAAAEVSGVGSLSALGLLLAGVALGGWAWRDRARRKAPLQATWGCGFSRTTPRMQLPPSSFAAPLLAAFGRWSAGRSRLAAAGAGYDQAVEDRVLAGLALPAWERIRRGALAVRTLQRGRVTQYLQYIVLTVVVLLVVLLLSVARAGTVSR